MIGIYERSLCQSYASAYRQGILIAKTDDEAEALSIVVTFDNSDYCYTKDINYCPMCGTKLGGDANGA